MEREQIYSFRELMSLDCVDADGDLYHGRNSTQIGDHERVFGGHLLAQALMAAFQTIPSERLAHNLHAYFIRPGNMNVKNEYQVTRSRDGHSFSSRQVDIRQQNKIITSLDISFCDQEEGLSHQSDMPIVPKPESLPERATQIRLFAEQAGILEGATDYVDAFLEVRPTLCLNQFEGEKGKPYSPEWLRLKEPLGQDKRLQQCAFAYMSDFSLMDVAFVPHGISWMDERVQSASLDHAIWFHKQMRADEWLLLVQESPVACGGRGFNRGTVFSRDGELVASLAQECLMRFSPDVLDQIS